MNTPFPAVAGSGLRLLIADDNRDAAESLAMLMSLDGHAVHVAHDGVTALSMAQRIRPDVLILDIGMPGMDGHAVAHRVRASLPDERMLIVAVTGRSPVGGGVSPQPSSFDFHFIKPVASRELSACIARWRAYCGVPGTNHRGA